MHRKLLFSFLTLSSASAWIACTAEDPAPSTTTGLSTGSTTDATTAGTSSTTVDATTGGTTENIDLTTGQTSEGGDQMREVECELDAAGNPILDAAGAPVCTCIKIATWGALGTYGAVPGMDGQDAIVAWLNQNSTGDAEYFAAKPAVTAEYLNNYDVIVIQDVSLWTPFSAEEKTAFEAWVRAGGGVITLNGYKADANEMANVNDLIAFSGMAYVPSSDTANETQRKTKLGICEDCYGAAVPQAGWTTHPIGLNMKQVGAFHGRSVMGGTPVAEEFGAVLGAAADIDYGHVFVFHDEWVTYNSQWTGAGLPTNCRDPNFSANGQCTLEHPVEQYTIAQFWYNSLKWGSGDPECFIIQDDTIIR